MNKKNQKKEEINIKTIWKAFRSEKGKRYSFIIFYFFFFIFLFIFINTNTKTTPNTSTDLNKQLEESSLPFITKNLENTDYKFKYIVISNNNELDYLGTKTNNKIYINDDTGEYEYSYQNGKLVSLNNHKMIHAELFDIYTIKRIIKSGKLVSETKLNETDEIIYNYTIRNIDLSDITLQNINNLDSLNEIKVKTNKNRQIENIEFNLLNYEKELNSELTIFKIILEIGDNIE